MSNKINFLYILINERKLLLINFHCYIGGSQMKSSRRIFILRTKEDFEKYEAREELINRVKAGYYKTKQQFMSEFKTVTQNLISQPMVQQTEDYYPFCL